MTLEILTGECIAGMRALPSASVDAIVTDPPYGLGKPPPIEEVLRAWLDGKPYHATGGGFMGREWDAFVPGPEYWREAFRVAKPGAHLVCFAGTRTDDLMGIALRLAGWVVRDKLCWLYGSGFPKSLDVSKAIDKAAGVEREPVPHPTNACPGGQWCKCFEAARGEAYSATKHPDGGAPATPEAAQWDGWGTALKPAVEFVTLCRKPLIGTVAENVLAHGTGGLNIEGCRIGTTKRVPGSVSSRGMDAKRASVYGTYGVETGSEPGHDPNVGRWPANLLLGCACDGDHDPGCAAAMLDEQSGERPGAVSNGSRGEGMLGTSTFAIHDRPQKAGRGDTGGASRFFFTAKASRSEREAGLSGARHKVNDGRETSIDNPYQRADSPRLNTHPTVKPLDLMRWLVRLVTPPGGLVLDLFVGSGTTGCAAAMEGFRFVGFELEEEYADIARQRIAYWQGVAEEEARQASMFDEPAKPSPLGLEVQDRQGDLFDGPV